MVLRIILGIFPGCGANELQDGILKIILGIFPACGVSDFQDSPKDHPGNFWRM